MIIGYIKRGTEHVRSEGNPGRRKAYEYCSLCHIRRKLRSQDEGRMPLRGRQERARKTLPSATSSTESMSQS